jgi:5-methylcytosine-specific restriction endonuclease McrA
VKQIECIVCNKSFISINSRHLRCGSRKLKTGCSWANRLIVDKRYRQTHPYNIRHSFEQRQIWAKKYRSENTKFCIALTTKWQKSHPENVAKASKRYRDHHKEKRCHWSRLYRDKRKNASGSYTLPEWESLKTLFGYTCPACLRSEPQIKLTIDHKVPIVKGGNNQIDNISPLCHSCNSRKHTQTWFPACDIKTKQLKSITFETRILSRQ